MSTVQEIKEAVTRLSPREQWELSQWLAQTEDVKELRRAELRRALAVGIAQADRGELTDSAKVFARLN